MEDRMPTSRAEPEPHAPSPARVILFDAEATSRARLRDALAPLGLPVLEAKTPLEAIYALARHPLDACVAFVGRRLLDTTPAEFVRFALEEFPGLNVITAGEEGDADHERVHRLDDTADTRALSELFARLGSSARDVPEVA